MTLDAWACGDNERMHAVLGLYTATYTDNTFHPLPIYPLDPNPACPTQRIRWGSSYWGLISKKQIRTYMGTTHFRLVSVDDLKTCRSPSDFPTPGTYEKIPYVTLKELCLTYFTYPDRAAFEKFEKERAGKAKRVTDGATGLKRIVSIPQDISTTNVLLDADQIDHFLKGHLDTPVSALMNKYPGMHYNFLCRSHEDSGEELQVAVRRIEEVKRGIRTLEHTLVDAFYRGTLLNFTTTLDAVLQAFPLSQIYDRLNIEAGLRVQTGYADETRLATHHGLEEYITLRSRYVVDTYKRAYYIASDYYDKIQYIREAPAKRAGLVYTEMERLKTRLISSYYLDSSAIFLYYLYDVFGVRWTPQAKTHIRVYTRSLIEVYMSLGIYYGPLVTTKRDELRPYDITYVKPCDTIFWQFLAAPEPEILRATAVDWAAAAARPSSAAAAAGFVKPRIMNVPDFAEKKTHIFVTVCDIVAVAQTPGFDRAACIARSGDYALPPSHESSLRL